MSASSGRDGKPANRARAVWPLLLWCLALGFVIWHAYSMDEYLSRVSAESFAGPEIELPRSRIPQGSAFDGQTWIREAEQLQAGDGWRFRQALHDNAPEGRPIYWSSVWGWWLIAGGKLWSFFNDLPFTPALESAAFWANLPVLLGVLVVFGVLCGRRWGTWAGALLVAVLAGHRGFYAAFYPGNSDHHGVIAACGAGLVLGVFWGGLGWRRSPGGVGAGRDWLPDSALVVRRMFAVSAVFGAVGMWFSAASMIPVLGAVAAAGLVAGRMRGEGLRFDADVWRWWGRVGGGLCLLFYFIEQFPDRLGWRLEVNHPVYAFAWAGAGEWLAWMMACRSAAWRRPTGRELLRLSWAGVLVVLPAVVLAIGGSSVFVLSEPLMAAVHATVTELEPLTHRIRELGWGHFAGYVVIQPALLLTAAGASWFWRKRPEGALVASALVMTVLILLLGWWQNRWMMIAGGPLAVLAVLALRVSWSRSGLVSRVLLVVLACFLMGWQPWQLWQERRAVAKVGDVQAIEARQLLYRDVARQIAADAAGQRVLLVAAPDASAAVPYYGDFETLGTLYWENLPGLYRASRLLAAGNEEEAADLAMRWGVTHFALFGFDGGGALFSPATGAREERALGPALLSGTAHPRWLRPIIYSIPPQFGRIENRVRLYAVDFEQTAAEAGYRHGMAAVAHGEAELAIKCFAEAAANAPGTPAPWFRLGEVELSLNRRSEALKSFLAGIATLPFAEREQAYLDAAKLFANYRAAAEANVLLDRAVSVSVE